MLIDVGGMCLRMCERVPEGVVGDGGGLEDQDVEEVLEDSSSLLYDCDSRWVGNMKEVEVSFLFIHAVNPARQNIITAKLAAIIIIIIVPFTMNGGLSVSRSSMYRGGGGVEVYGVGWGGAGVEEVERPVWGTGEDDCFLAIRC